MNFLVSLKNFLLFKYSFRIETALDPDLVMESFQQMIRHDKSFLYPVIQDYEFGFSYKNFMPGWYQFSAIYFEGLMSRDGQGTIIQARAGVFPFILWIGVVAILAIFLGDYLLPKEEQHFKPEDFQMKFLSLIYFLNLYIYYTYKVWDVKGVIKRFVKREENKHLSK